MDILDSLSDTQRETLQQFQSVTNTEDLETAIVVLQSAGWDLEVSVRIRSFPILAIKRHGWGGGRQEAWKSSGGDRARGGRDARAGKVHQHLCEWRGSHSADEELACS